MPEQEIMLSSVEALAVVTTIAISGLGFFFKAKFDETVKTAELLRVTREQIAREHITRAEYRAELDKLSAHIDTGFQRLERKIEALYDSHSK